MNESPEAFHQRMWVQYGPRASDVCAECAGDEAHAYECTESRIGRAKNEARDAALEEAAAIFDRAAESAMENARGDTKYLARDKMQAHARNIRALKTAPGATLASVRDAALEEAAVCGERMRDWDDEARRDFAAAIRALKSKPAPQPSGNSGEFNSSPEPLHDFGWALQQMRAGKKVRRWAWSPMACVAMNERHDGFVNHAGGEWLVGPNDLLSDKWELAE